MKRTILFLLFLVSGAAVTAQTPCSEPGPAIGSTGCVTFIYDGQTVQYTTVRAADGNVWLQQNLGSSAVATSATDTNAYGDLFQWGRWNDGHEKRNSAGSAIAPSPNNPSGLTSGNNNFLTSTPAWWTVAGSGDAWDGSSIADVTETSGCDPCKAALGNGWRVPTSDEWQAIITTENLTDITAAFNSNLKLTVAGSRSGVGGGFTSVGQRGYYWSSTPSPSNANYGKYLFYSNISMNANAGASRSQGTSVRCIKGISATPPAAPTGIAIITQGNVPAEIITNAGTLQLLAVVSPGNANQSATWSITSGSEFASVNGAGLVTATANGSVTVQAVSSEAPSITNTITVTITNQVPAPTAVNIAVADNAAATITANEGTLQLMAAVLPVTANQSVTWSITAGAEFASVNETGLVSALENGTVTVQAVSTVNNTLLDTIEVVITGQITLPQTVVISVADNAAATITENEGTLQLNAAVLPASADQTVTWTITEGTEFASVSEGGLITAIANGTITVQAVSTVDAAILDTIEVVITNQYIAPVNLEVTTENNVNASIITTGGTLQLEAAIVPAEADQTVIWSVTAGSEFATVDASGLVTALADGVITIQAVSTDDNTLLDTITVNIINQNPASAAPYCDATVEWDVEPISRVAFANIDNASSAAVNASPAYENFTAIIGNVIQNDIYSLAVEGNTVGMFEHDIRVFIDWNQNDEFDMATEYYHTSIHDTDGTDGTQAVINITIPADAAVGTTRMRITKDMWNVFEEGEFDACTDAYYGQVEDYTLSVTSPVAGLDDLNKTRFTVYPNPTHDLLTIQSQAAVKNIEAYNIAGQLIAQSGNALLSLSKAAAGIYIVKISFENGSTATEKIIKQ